MDDNPYTPGSISSKPKTRASRRWLWAGFTSLALATLCIIATVIGMIWSFDAVANSSTAPKPSDLATGISNAMIPSIGAMPLALLGVALLVVGFIRREPIDSK
ncbi:MotA/TolQ/ExbB proton channel family protein [Novipirellula galeiformis]|uniref:MotA/TolQ/ExbB proton channel family protein n=1 Tax=Novipirellula galeiformis TaxID=2528004 RepID=UPI0011B6B878|nr:MotA/TolQ/ExbB proton channel family protein [Novipirellula galeiformis]